MVKAAIPVIFVFVKNKENGINNLKHVSINSTKSLTVPMYTLALWSAHNCTGKYNVKGCHCSNIT